MGGFSGQGKVSLGKRNAVTGLPGVMRWLGNAPGFTLGLDEEVSEKNESFSGNRLSYRRSVKARTGTLNIKFDEFSKENMAVALAAAVTTTVAGAAVVAQLLPSPVKIGESLLLGSYNVTAVAVRDSTGAPKTLTPNVNYRLNALGGSIDIIDLTIGGPFVMPLRADFTPGIVVQVGAFKEASPEYFLQLDGINTDTGEKMIAEVFRARLSPMKSFEMIGDDIVDFELEGSVLADPTRAAESTSGQFFNLIFAPAV